MNKLVLLLGGISTLWLACAASLRAQEVRSGPWVMQVSGSTAGLRGIHAVGGGVAWAGGTDGTVLRTEDGGYMWQRCSMPPGAEKLDFRGIWAWDENTAVVMSSGLGDLSRIYKTTDGCSHWILLYTDPDKDGFWDGIGFWDRDEGLVVGDPVKGRFFLGRISIGAQPSTRPQPYGSPPVMKEALFAASNSSLFLAQRFRQGDSTLVFLGTGGESGPHIYEQQMHTFADVATARWVSSPVPLHGGTNSSGVFSLAFRDDGHGIAVGGDYTKPNDSSGTAAWTTDGGQHWTAAQRRPHGYRSAVAWDADAEAWIAVGTNGSDISYDDGKTWTPLDNGNWNALSLPWVVGPQGRIAKIDTGKLPHK